MPRKNTLEKAREIIARRWPFLSIMTEDFGDRLGIAICFEGTPGDSRTWSRWAAWIPFSGGPSFEKRIAQAINQLRARAKLSLDGHTIGTDPSLELLHRSNLTAWVKRDPRHGQFLETTC